MIEKDTEEQNASFESIPDELLKTKSGLHAKKAFSEEEADSRSVPPAV